MRDHFQENTTLITVVTNAVLSKMDCFLLAQSGHDGLARAIFPPHLGSDGDAVVAAATGKVEADSVDVVRALVVAAVEQAVHQAC
jgi:L-aminopeptidase/D-esterase-like protein